MNLDSDQSYADIGLTIEDQLRLLEHRLDFIDTVLSELLTQTLELATRTKILIEVVSALAPGLDNLEPMVYSETAVVQDDPGT